MNRRSEAATFAERVRSIVEQLKFSSPMVRITASFGVALFLPEDTQDTLLNRMDTALYQAKEGGRNRVMI